MGLKIDTKSFNKKLRKINSDINRKVAKKAVSDTADIVIKDAKQITPVDTGELRNSLEQKTVATDSGAEAVMGTDVEHSVIVHEDMSATHKNGQAKFLEKGLRKNAKTLIKQAQQEFRRLR